jgi:hypothetical protein
MFLYVLSGPPLKGWRENLTPRYLFSCISCSSLSSLVKLLPGFPKSCIFFLNFCIIFSRRSRRSMRRRRTLTRRSLTWRGRRVTTPSRRRRRSSLSATLLRSLLPLPYLVASRVPWWVLLNSSLLTFSFPGSLSV